MENRKAFIKGLYNGLPIGLGYYAVAFSLGFMARKCTLTPIQGFIGSFFTRASAGEYGVYSMVVQDAPYLAIVAMSLVTNLRYLLMSTALSQKFSKDTPLITRILTGCCVTDEIFGISIAYKGYLNPCYTFGAFAISTPMWALGTTSGIIAGNVLPARVVSALSVALYGMFIAIVIPPCKKEKGVLAVSLAAVVISLLFKYVFTAVSGGFAMIICAVAASLAGAWLFPVKDAQEGEE